MSATDRTAAAAGRGAAGGDGLRQAAVQGVKWSFVAAAGSNVGRLAFTFVLARLLGPENFGIVASATIYTTFVMVLLDQGFGQAIIQRRELRDDDVGTVGTINVVSSLVLAAATVAVAPLVADFFHTPELTAVLRVLSSLVLIKGLAIVPAALMRRDLGFRRLAMIQNGTMVVGGLAGIAAAVAGAEYWSLVVQTLVTEALTLVALLAINGRPVLRASLASMRSMWAFSAALMGGQLLTFVGQNADNLIIGNVLDPRQLAFYALSYRLLRLPLQLIGSAVNGVALPVFARLQDDRPRVAAWYLRAQRTQALIAWPVFVLIALSAPAGVPLVFGPAWEPAIVPLQLLALGGTLGVIRMLGGPLATALGRADMVLLWSILSVVPSVIGYLIGVRFGIVGVATAYLVVAWATAIPNFAHVHGLIGLSMGRFLRNLGVPLAAAAVLAGSWLAVRLALHAAGVGGPGLAQVVELVVPAAVAVGAYAAAVRFVWPATFAECRDLLGSMRGGAAA